MEKFFKRKSGFDLPAPIPQEHGTNEMQHISKISRVEIDLSKLPSDPGSRPPISSYHPNVQDSIRRRYLQNGPCQPRRHIFPQTKFGNNLRRFNKEWFTDHKGWLEYSESKDAAFCFYCYLFRPSGGEKSGHDVFILGGFRNWKTPSKLRDKHADNIIRKIESGELLSGQGQNQETSLKRSGETRWGSHYGTLINLIVMFASVIDLLDIVVKDGSSSEQRGEAYALLESMQSFDFIMSLHLMRSVLGVTNELSKALQREDQDIVNAICLVNTSKKRLQSMRDNGWDLLLREVSSFCVEHIIHVPQMDASFVARGRSRRRTEVITNLHHYRAELFYTCIDMQLQELNNRFDEVNSELLLCMACLNPVKSFLAFDKQKIIRLSQFYPNDFTASDRMVLQDQLETYIMDVKSNAEFFELDGLGTLAKKMVESKKDIVYPLVYLLIKLSLILPVATATVERAFSAMHLVKNRLRNRMGDDWLNDLLVTYIEKDIFKSIENEVIMQRFQNMKDRRGKLSLL